MTLRITTNWIDGSILVEELFERRPRGMLWAPPAPDSPPRYLQRIQTRTSGEQHSIRAGVVEPSVASIPRMRMVSEGMKTLLETLGHQVELMVLT